MPPVVIDSRCVGVCVCACVRGVCVYVLALDDDVSVVSRGGTTDDDNDGGEEEAQETTRRGEGRDRTTGRERRET